MEWIQTITLGVTLIAYMTGVCVFFYHLNEKNINKTEDRLERNETHWREMFMYMSGRIDGSKETNAKIDQVLSKNG